MGKRQKKKGGLGAKEQGIDGKKRKKFLTKRNEKRKIKEEKEKKEDEMR